MFIISFLILYYVDNILLNIGVVVIVYFYLRTKFNNLKKIESKIFNKFKEFKEGNIKEKSKFILKGIGLIIVILFIIISYQAYNAITYNLENKKFENNENDKCYDRYVIFNDNITFYFCKFNESEIYLKINGENIKYDIVNINVNQRILWNFNEYDVKNDIISINKSDLMEYDDYRFKINNISYLFEIKNINKFNKFKIINEDEYLNHYRYEIKNCDDLIYARKSLNHKFYNLTCNFEITQCKDEFIIGSSEYNECFEKFEFESYLKGYYVNLNKFDEIRNKYQIDKIDNYGEFELKTNIPIISNDDYDVNNIKIDLSNTDIINISFDKKDYGYRTYKYSNIQFKLNNNLNVEDISQRIVLSVKTKEGTFIKVKTDLNIKKIDNYTYLIDRTFEDIKDIEIKYHK